MSDTGQGKGRGAGTGLRCVSIAAPSCRVTVIKRAHSPGRAHLGRLLRDGARVAHARGRSGCEDLGKFPTR
jgi:hypothetical protein